MRSTSIAAVAALMLGAASTPVAGQRPAAGNYDTATVQTVSGTVIRIDTIAARGGAEGGVHVQLRTDKDTLPVHLGPAWYVGEQSMKLAAGDRLTVRGSRVTYEGKPAIIAATVTKGAAELKLRDASGRPA
jgi:hypothetical protein